MIVSTPSGFRAAASRDVPPPDRAATARAVFLVQPDGFRLSTQSASDNTYMDLALRVDPERALAQHGVLADAIRRHTRLPVQVFPGSAETPDAVFPNNVFATVPGRLIVGAMRHAERQREAQRADIASWFEREHGYDVAYLDRAPGVVTELTGPLVLDRARGIGLHGRTERLNDAGIAATHAAFDLRLSFAFDLIAGEYHTNVIMAVLAGRAVVLHQASFADPEAAQAIAAFYGRHAIAIGDEEKLAFAGNCIALAPDQVWMSATAERALARRTRKAFDDAGFTIYTVQIDEIEKAGGSLRCCVAEIF